MDHHAKADLRNFIKTTLTSRGDDSDVTDSDSLFISGRLDSLSMMTLIVYLEKSFRIDFAEVDFEVGLIDSVNEITAFVDAHLAR